MTDQLKGKTLVVGAGAGGIQASLDLARAGYQVILAEGSDHTGGLISQLDLQFPTTACGFCRMLPMADRDKGSQHCLRRGLSHENIDLRLSTALMNLSGEAGAFTASLEQAAPLVDQEKCMGCGICEQVCPVEVPDPFNAGLAMKKAVARPCPQSFPNAWAIDPATCTRCGECVTACPTGAITLSPSDRAAFKILVVDDEAIIRDSMKEWLGLEGFGVETAASGKEALELMETREFEVLLTDIKMPGMDGVELLARAKERLPGITVIMMTAYAEVDSAVNAMKQGALDYVTKPFEPETVIELVEKIYGEFKAGTAVKEEVAAVILATGTGFYMPDREKDIYGYGRIPNVVTALEFERRLSPAGPGGMDGVRRIAWLQCVGSRDRSRGFCSSACCMISIKQALLAKENLPDLDRAAVFYMDLRTPGKEFDAYRAGAETAGVAFVRSRIHSIVPNPSGSGPLSLRYLSRAGQVSEEPFDMVVLAVGQALSPGAGTMIEALGLETDDWGFVRPPEFVPHGTSQPGIFTTGGLTGFKDIETTVTLGAAAAMAAARTMDGPGDSRRREAPESNGLDMAAPQIQVLICPCSRQLNGKINLDGLSPDPQVALPAVVDDLCTPEGWEKALEILGASDCNRLVLAGCPGCTGREKLTEAAAALDIPARLVRPVDILGLAGKLYSGNETRLSADAITVLDGLLARAVGRAVSGLKAALPRPPGPAREVNRALVVGGGVAGMTAAMAIAGAGFGVDLVEKSGTLGGNLSWIKHTIEGKETAGLLAGLVEGVSAHDRINVHLSARVSRADGLPGRWHTMVERSGENGVPERIRVDHGVVVLATGGKEADAGESGPGVYTQKDFQAGLDAGELDPAALSSLVMIQCRNCREADKNYCSRVCCPRALAQALFLKEKNPGIAIYVLYRDMMTPGGLEAFYTRAREAGVIFIPYQAGQPPEIRTAQGEPCRVACHDPVLDRGVEIKADAVVTAVGVVPVLPRELARMFTAERDDFGFFRAADSKWRPVDARHPRVLGCGLALKPCDIDLARATALAAAVRAVGVLSGVEQGAAARVKTAYCSLCLTCIPACPFNARTLDEESGTIAVDGQACQGCGICAAVCPSKAARVDGKSHYLDVIDSVLAN
ncbi:MAG: response regulator [Desulfobacter sp.]|nr:MAG: response regulator [Desulfobacter sp.]